MTTHVLVDSTADIPLERARELGITVVPLTVVFGDESFLDGIELDGPAFYRKLVSSHQTPTTSTPSPGLFEEAYRKLIDSGATGILALHIGSGLSGTFSASHAAAESGYCRHQSSHRGGGFTLGKRRLRTGGRDRSR